MLGQTEATMQLASQFRPGQLEAMLPVVHGRRAFVRMPTGGRKTFYISLPPLALAMGLGLIIYNDTCTVFVTRDYVDESVERCTILHTGELVSVLRLMKLVELNGLLILISKNYRMLSINQEGCDH